MVAWLDFIIKFHNPALFWGDDYDGNHEQVNDFLEHVRDALKLVGREAAQSAGEMKMAHRFRNFIVFWRWIVLLFFYDAHLRYEAKNKSRG